MGIIFKDTKIVKSKLPTFGSLKIGECFEADLGDYYIKTSEVNTSICLRTGRKFFFTLDDPVRRVRIEATIKG